MGKVTAVAYDNPIPGFQTNNTINLRLWAAKPGQEFDLQAFNTGDYVQVASRPCPALQGNGIICTVFGLMCQSVYVAAVHAV